MRQFDYNQTRADFENATKCMGMDFEMIGGGYASKSTACAWVGWCIRVQHELEKNQQPSPPSAD